MKNITEILEKFDEEFNPVKKQIYFTVTVEIKDFISKAIKSLIDNAPRDFQYHGVDVKKIEKWKQEVMK